jgi:hypothetical protein
MTDPGLCRLAGSGKPKGLSWAQTLDAENRSVPAPNNVTQNRIRKKAEFTKDSLPTWWNG